MKINLITSYTLKSVTRYYPYLLKDYTQSSCTKSPIIAAPTTNWEFPPKKKFEKMMV
jgi:hypothetical protein